MFEAFGVVEQGADLQGHAVILRVLGKVPSRRFEFFSIERRVRRLTAVGRGGPGMAPVERNKRSGAAPIQPIA